MSQIKIKIEVVGAIGRHLPTCLEISCNLNSSVYDVLNQISFDYPSALAMLERCACAIGEDIIPRQNKLTSDSTLVLLSPVAGG